ncbi:MAG: EMC3/TMCO1 family protein [Candidatus Aenigmatarchaeota archaeon]
MSFNPAISIFFISTIVSIFLTFINKKTMGKTNVKELKDKMNKLKKEMSEAQKKKDTDKLQKKMDEMMELNSKYMKVMMKPMLISLGISMLIVILIFPIMKEAYNSKVVLVVPRIIPLIGGKGLTWIWWYVICSIAVGLVLRKIMGV